MPKWPKRQGWWPQVGPFEPLDVDPCQTWEIYDPNDAKLLAIVYDGQLAGEILEFLNTKLGFSDVKVTPPADD